MTFEVDRMTFEEWWDDVSDVYFDNTGTYPNDITKGFSKEAWEVSNTMAANEPSKSISGYRELSKEEIELINQIKDLGEELQLLLLNIEASGLADPRWIDIARTNMQLGSMAAVRAVAKPNSF